jgi:hypothetical protein
MHRFAWILAVITIAVTARVGAQARPDFSGTWGSPASLTIKQDARTLTVTTGGETRTYNLDGSDSRFERRSDRGTTSQLTSQATWVGSALVITTTTVSSIGTWEDLEVYSLDYGPKLTVVRVGTQTTRPMMYTTTTVYVPIAAATPSTNQRSVEALLEMPRFDANIRIASLKHEKTPISLVMGIMADLTRLTAHYDQSVPELTRTCTVNLVNASLDEALDAVLRANGMAFTVLGPKEVFVYSDTPANREKYAWSVRAFPVANADPAALTSLLYKQFLTGPGIRPIIVASKSPSPTITVRATGEKMAVIAKLIAENDKR